jgi:hypothetical protein
VFVPAVYVQIHERMNPVDVEPSRRQSSSAVVSSRTHAPRPLSGDRTTNAALSCGAVTVSVADIAELAYVAVIVTVVDDCTVAVSTRNVALREPAATVTVAGSFTTLASLVDSTTSAPPSGAGEASVTVTCG